MSAIVSELEFVRLRIVEDEASRAKRVAEMLDLLGQAKQVARFGEDQALTALLRAACEIEMDLGHDAIGRVMDAHGIDPVDDTPFEVVSRGPRSV